jgi:hypothetical protein
MYQYIEEIWRFLCVVDLLGVLKATTADMKKYIE